MREGLLLLLLALIPLGLKAQGADPGQVDAMHLSAEERLLLGEPAAAQLEGETLAARAHQLTSRMRCPVCQGLSIADSTTPAARAIAARVEALLAAGYSEEQVLTYFEASYGEFIRLAPKPEGLNLVVWLLPVVALTAAAVWLSLRARRAGGESVDQVSEDLADYLHRVRDEVSAGEVER